MPKSYKSNRKGRIRNNILKVLGGALGTAAKYGVDYGLSRISGSKNSTSGVQFTNQKDSKVQYKKKSRSRKSKKRWRKFSKKVRAVSMKLVGTNTHLKNGLVGRSGGVSGQAWMALHLYGFKGTEPLSPGGELGVGDIESINNADSRINDASKIVFSSAVLDATLRNSGTVDLEVDIYELSYRDRVSDNNMYYLIGKAQNNTPVIPGSLSQITLNSRGATLFDLPMAIKYGKIKIWKKTKVFLPQGETTNYQIRDPRNHVYDMANLADDNGYVEPGMTKTLLVVYKNVAGTSIDGTDLQIGCTRKYAYKIFEDSTDYDVYV